MFKIKIENNQNHNNLRAVLKLTDDVQLSSLFPSFVLLSNRFCSLFLKTTK